MRLKLFRSLWGIDKTWEDAFPLIKAEGFVGIETGLPTPGDADRFRALLDEHGFEFLAMAFTGGATVDEHVKSLHGQLLRAKELGAAKVTCHSGQDRWSPAQQESFYKQVVEVEKAVGIPVGHETHRGRSFYNPWVTRDMLQKFPSLRLCCDFSHWVCVAERLNWDDGGILNLCAERCIHIHARVGYEEGPQVPDPSAPEWKHQLEAHELWWQSIWALQKASGVPTTTVTPEFGPPNYLHTVPHTNVPVANLWNVCKWMADRIAARFVVRELTT